MPAPPCALPDRLGWDPYTRPLPAGERHGTAAERLLASQMRAKQAQQSRPHTLFATGPKQAPQAGAPLPQVRAPRPGRAQPRALVGACVRVGHVHALLTHTWPAPHCAAGGARCVGLCRGRAFATGAGSPDAVRHATPARVRYAAPAAATVRHAAATMGLPRWHATAPVGLPGRAAASAVWHAPWHAPSPWLLCAAAAAGHDAAAAAVMVGGWGARGERGRETESAREI